MSEKKFNTLKWLLSAVSAFLTSGLVLLLEVQR